MIPHTLHRHSYQSQQLRGPNFPNPGNDFGSSLRQQGHPNANLYQGYPAEIHNPHNLICSQGSGSIEGRQNSDQAEHMLRRKTPIGTLAAGYDGTPLHWSSKVPVPKHVKTPLSEELQQKAQSGSICEERNLWLITQSEQDNFMWGSMKERDVNVARMSNWACHSSINNPHPIALNHPEYTRRDSTSNSLQAHKSSQQQPDLNDSNQIYSIGPNDRFAYNKSPFNNLQSNFQKTHAFQGSKNVRYSPTQFLSAPPAQASFGDSSSNDNSGWFPNLKGSPVILHSEATDFYENKKLFQQEPCLKQHMPFLIQPPEMLASHNLQSVNKSEYSLLYEKTLCWAKKIHIDLMNFLNLSSRGVSQVEQTLDNQYFLTNQTYPSPPRPLYSCSEILHWQSPIINQNILLGTDENGSALASMVRTSSVTSRNINREQNLLQHPNQCCPHTQLSNVSYLNPKLQNQPTLNQVTPLFNAKEAINTLTNLCVQSGWNWIDGMLLCGCLAHALQEYHKALDFFSKIISLESNHVEAMSNLATTLLCLDRRKEAEHYWLQSIAIQPSYFQAVEKLIGLLCSENRGPDAISVIEFVEKYRQQKMKNILDNHINITNITEYDSINLSESSIESTTIDINGNKMFTSSHSGKPTPKYGLFPSSVSNKDSTSCFEKNQTLALIYARGNILLALDDINGAAKAFERVILTSIGGRLTGTRDFVNIIVETLSEEISQIQSNYGALEVIPPLLLSPEKALQTAKLVMRKCDLPGLYHLPEGPIKKEAVSIISNSLLSLAKIFQDAISNSQFRQKLSGPSFGVGDILALYYFSLSLQPSPSTANNIGILLASVQQTSMISSLTACQNAISTYPTIPGIPPASSVSFAVAFYHYGLNLDPKHAHIYTNLGSLLKDIGQLTAAVSMYEKAVACDGSFDIALANLANAVKDQGRTSDAIEYFRRAVASSPNFAEAVCGLANSLNSVCDWVGRGGVLLDNGHKDKWHVDDQGMITDGKSNGSGCGWMKRVIDIVAKQLIDGSTWGLGVLREKVINEFLQRLENADSAGAWPPEKRSKIYTTLKNWSGCLWEGARIIRLAERAIRRAMYRWYIDKHVNKCQLPSVKYPRPLIPTILAAPSAPTVLPFHTFTCPLPAKDIRLISQLNAIRISCSTLKTPLMQGNIFPPPGPPSPYLNVGYVSSDFNNHPLAHLMQSVFGMHDISRVKAFCYATTASDNSVHRQKIEREAPVFRDISSWSIDQTVEQITRDNIHILVNLNGYTRGARNEIFAARPAPIQMSFMGFAGTLGAEWCDYLLADETVIPSETLRPRRRNLDIEDQILNEEFIDDENWVYSENIIFCRDTFFCCDHAQSKPRNEKISWEEEQARRWRMRKEIFPGLSDDAVILGNFNQLYKIEPTTFRTWLRILDKVPQAILWLLRFPDLGENNLKRTAREWAGESVACRIWFSDVAPKNQHISRARVCDLFLDTPECNAHTTAADILWSSTPLLTLPRYKYKMCSRMAASILKGALPKCEEGRKAAHELIAKDEDQYEQFAIILASNLKYEASPSGYFKGTGRLNDLRKLLYDSRLTCALFDTKRWVSDLEIAYTEAWRRWVADEGGDIYLKYLESFK